MEPYPHNRRFAAGAVDPPPPPLQQQHPNPGWYPGPPMPMPSPPPSAAAPAAWPPVDPHYYMPPQMQPPGSQMVRPPFQHPGPPHFSGPPPPYRGGHGYPSASPHPPHLMANSWPQRLPVPPQPPHAGNPHYPPPPGGFLPQAQARPGASWTHNQAWEYPDRNIPVPHNNEEDWASKAKEWAAANSVTENFQSQQQPHATPTQYHEYKLPVDPSAERFTVPLGDSSNRQAEVNTFTGSALFGSGSRYATDASRLPDTGVEVAVADNVQTVSPTMNFRSIPPTYEQEVPYNYSSTPGNFDTFVQRTASMQNHRPLASSIQDGFIHPPPARDQSLERRYSMSEESSKLMTSPSDRPLEFNYRSANGNGLHQTGAAGHVGIVDHDSYSAAAQSWAPSSASFFPQPPIPPTVPQMDLPAITQPSLPLHPTTPLFGGISGPNYGPAVPPTPFGIGTGTSVPPAEAFYGDLSVSSNITERPKKSAVPNWLREEILKNKSALAGTPMQQNGNVSSVDADKSLKQADQSDRKSIDSTKSTEDEDEDEDEVEAARNAAISQEIKRVLTEVLLKVTNDLFDEIATKVLEEDDLPPVEAVEPFKTAPKVPVNGSASKASAKSLAPVKANNHIAQSPDSDSEPISPKGDILGLASYASDDEDDDSQRVIQPNNGIKANSSNHQENLKPFAKKDLPMDRHNSMDEKGDRSAATQSNVSVIDMNGSREASVHVDRNSKNINSSGSSSISDDSRIGSGVPSKRGQDNSSHPLIKGQRNSETASNATDSSRNTNSISVTGSAKDSVEPTRDDKGKLSTSEVTVGRSKDESGDQKRSERFSSTEEPGRPTKIGLYQPESESRAVNHQSSVEHATNRKEKSDKRGNVVDRDHDSSSRQYPDSKDIKDDKRDRGKDGREKKKDDFDRRRERQRATDENEYKSRESGRSSTDRDSKSLKVHNRRSPSPIRSSPAQSTKRSTSPHRKSVSHRSKRSSSPRRRSDIRNSRTSPSPTKSSALRSRRSPSPRGHTRSSKEERSLRERDGVSDNGRSESPKKRKSRTEKDSKSPSPKTFRSRKVSRSPQSKPSQRRHSPYSSSSDRQKRPRSRSRSRTPVRRR